MTEAISDLDGKNGATTPGMEQDAISGWGVFRRDPWDFIGIYDRREDAEQERRRVGEDYEVAFGTGHIGSNRFEVLDAQPVG